jgi:hypothetical protein
VKFKDLDDLKLIERKDLRRQEREERRVQRALRAIARKERRRERWPRWVTFWEEVARHLKTAALVVGSTVAVISGGIALYKYAASAAHAVRRALTFYADRGVPPPDPPPPSGGASTAVDRLPPRPAPKDSPGPETSTKDQR